MMSFIGDIYKNLLYVCYKTKKQQQKTK